MSILSFFFQVKWECLCCTVYFYLTSWKKSCHLCFSMNRLLSQHEFGTFFADFLSSLSLIFCVSPCARKTVFSQLRDQLFITVIFLGTFVASFTSANATSPGVHHQRPPEPHACRLREPRTHTQFWHDKYKYVYITFLDETADPA